MKTLTLTAAIALFAAPVLANTSVEAIQHFNQSKEGGDVIELQGTLSTANGTHSPEAQAIFDRIEAESAEDE
ncbi:hypothetical protein [Jannaschia pohangensis]|uniref:Uncharacterized protein n=1 Tax=Jannaschia pohangensis TaxID=390807 RepID=A0A1I3UCL4_9RHOB|nr:hypothetical protein [Jannaschia pohangensis]SFJ80652.1 hypothetical protein SAMN04488095_3716 [Jannaschia pohangensis]